jgi:hypothetical protein
MFECRASFPLFLLEPSLKTKTGVPPADPTDDKPNNTSLLRHNEKQLYNISFSKGNVESQIFEEILP